MTSVNDTDANFKTCERLINIAKAKGCCMCFLPECFAFIGAQKGEAQAVAEPLEGKLMARYKFLAKTAAIWMSLGGFQEKIEGDTRIYNTHVILDSDGQIKAFYRHFMCFDNSRIKFLILTIDQENTFI